MPPKKIKGKLGSGTVGPSLGGVVKRLGGSGSGLGRGTVGPSLGGVATRFGSGTSASNQQRLEAIRLEASRQAEINRLAKIEIEKARILRETEEARQRLIRESTASARSPDFDLLNIIPGPKKDKEKQTFRRGSAGGQGVLGFPGILADFTITTPDFPRKETRIIPPPKIPAPFTTSSPTGKGFFEGGFFTETELGRSIRGLPRTGGEVVSSITSLGGLLERKPTSRGSAFVPIPDSIDLEKDLFRSARETGTLSFKTPAETGETSPEQKFEVTNLKVQTQLNIDTNKLQDNLVNKFQGRVDSGSLNIQQANTQLQREFNTRQNKLTQDAQVKLDRANMDLQRGILAANVVPSFLEGLVFGGIAGASPPIGAALFAGSVGGLIADFPDIAAQATTFPKEFASTTAAGLLGAGVGGVGTSKVLRGISREPEFTDLRIKTQKPKRLRLKTDKELLLDIESRMTSKEITSATTSKLKRDLLEESIKRLDELEISAPDLKVLEISGKEIVSLQRPRSTKAQIREVSGRLKSRLKSIKEDDVLKAISR